MGTNVYMQRIPTESELNEIKANIDKLDFQKASELMEKYRSEVHIGKRSGGWQFLFAPNPEYYEETRESIDKFLHRKDWELVTEYYDYITPEDFWQDFVEDFKDGYSHESYIQAHPMEDRWPSLEHYSDGLRFSNSKDFA